MRQWINISSLLLLLSGCTKNFELPDTKPDNTVLVVEGDIKTGGVIENTFVLSRVKALFEVNDIPETNALVEIVQQNGPRWTIPHKGKGVYSAPLNLPDNAALSLKITSADGKIYETPFQKSVLTPPIDSVTWKQELNGGDVKLYVHTRDVTNNTRNYKWTYTETWERRSWFNSLYDFVGGSIVPRDPANDVSTCYNSSNGSTYIVGNSNDLKDDVISYQPITLIEKPSEKLYVRYSILVRQIGLTKEAYDYWDILKKNTELRGTLFDPQPSRMPTNIVCTNDSKREAIGYISVGKVSEKRIFIMNSAVNLWPTRNEANPCDSYEYPRFLAERFLSQNSNYLPAYFVTAGGGFGVAIKQCIDCRITGGVTTKPDFW